MGIVFYLDIEIIWFGLEVFIVMIIGEFIYIELEFDLYIFVWS